MELSPDELRLVTEAEHLIRLRGTEHSHAAAVLTTDGDIFRGVNLFHFSGGPCAEIVALGRMLTDGHSQPRTVVAVARDGRGVVSPCGVCRQILHDRWPGTGVILLGDGGLRRVPLDELLPQP